MDRFLLNIGAFFMMVYNCFTITVGVFPKEEDDFTAIEKGNISSTHEDALPSPHKDDFPGELHIVAGLLNLLQVGLQVTFLELLLSRRIESGETHHPGRQAVTLLVLLNLALWLVDTFALQVTPHATSLTPRLVTEVLGQPGGGEVLRLPALAPGAESHAPPLCLLQVGTQGPVECVGYVDGESCVTQVPLCSLAGRLLEEELQGGEGREE